MRFLNARSRFNSWWGHQSLFLTYQKYCLILKCRQNLRLMTSVFYISFFGLLGLLSRYGVDQAFVKWNAQFPISTLLINLTGSLLAGIVYAISLENKDFPVALQTGLLIGFCGGFTTFSAYTLQTLQMIERGKVFPALTYLVISPTLGLIMAFLPIFIMRKFVS